MGGQDRDCLWPATPRGHRDDGREDSGWWCWSCSVPGIVQTLWHVLVKPQEVLVFGISVTPVVQIK